MVLFTNGCPNPLGVVLGDLIPNLSRGSKVTVEERSEKEICGRETMNRMLRKMKRKRKKEKREREKQICLRDLGTHRRSLIKSHNKHIVGLEVPVHDLAPMEILHPLGAVEDKTQLHNELHPRVLPDVAVEASLRDILGHKAHPPRERHSSNKLDLGRKKKR